MRARRIATLAAVLMLPVRVAAAQAAETWCNSTHSLEWLTGVLHNVVAGGTDSSSVRSRRIYGIREGLTADSLIVVRDERVCERAARTYYRYSLGPMPAGGIAVVRFGDRYAVYGHERAGEWTILKLYNSAFEAIASVAM